MAIIYCIPGTGADGRLFANLRLGDHEIRHVKWILPHSREKLQHYAFRLAEQIDTRQPFALVGVSLGGMLCTALTEKLKPIRTFVIASSKCRDELPPQLRLLKYFPFYRLLHDRAYVHGALLSRRLFGFKGRADGLLFRDMLYSAPEGYYSRAIDCIVSWDATSYPEGIIHIHGNRDKMIPIKWVKPDYVIDGGSHNLVYDHSDAISDIIRKELDKALLRKQKQEKINVQT
jgi:pimeloyl-ACP methyl ester carboxylesterase